MAVLGTCPGTTDEFATMYPNVVINEVTTVAAAYAIAGFAVNPITVSANTSTQARLGLGNAFATAANMADITSGGSALAATSVVGSIVPQAEIDTLANAVSACINSGGNALASTNPAAPATFSSNCSTLLNAAVTVSGVAATDTADALINLAHNPSAGGQANVTAIYGLAPGTGAAFQPALTGSTPPTDFSIAISYPAGNSTNGPGNAKVAVDSQGNVWTTNYLAGTVSEISPLGVLMSGANGFTDGGMNNDQALAFDRNGKLWVLNEVGGAISELNPDGSAVTGSPFTPYSGSTTYPLIDPQAIAIDASNHLWITDTGCPSTSMNCSGTTPVLDVLTNTSGACLIAACGNIATNLSDGVAIDDVGNIWVSSTTADVLAGYASSANPPLYSVANVTAADFAGSYGLSIDSKQVKWVAEGGTNQITSVTPNNTVTSYPPSGQPDGGLNAPIALAIDGADNIWTANVGGIGTVSISEFTNAGVPLSPPSVSTSNPGGFQALNTNLQGIGGIAIDLSGNVWVSDYNTIYLTELVGAATPVLTPIVAAGIANGTLGEAP